MLTVADNRPHCYAFRQGSRFTLLDGGSGQTQKPEQMVQESHARRPVAVA